MAAPDAIRAVLACLVGLAPLRWGKARLKELGVQGHSPHVSLTDIAWMIGPSPSFPFPVDVGAARGFSRDDRRELGHWAGEAENGASDEVEAAVLPPRESRQGRGQNRPRHCVSRRHDMDLVYSRGTGRMGEESRQLVVCGRLSRIIRLAYAAYG
jgi:hypothetical protein